MAKYQIDYKGGSIKATKKNHKTEIYKIPFAKLNPNEVGFEVKNLFVVYILFARNFAGKDYLYVGKSTNGIFKRPKLHKDKFAAEICYILTQEAGGTFFNDGTIQYLEDQIKKRVDFCNTFSNMTDKTNAGTANSSDMEDCDDYLKEAYEILYVLGLDLYSRDGNDKLDVEPEKEEHQTKSPPKAERSMSQDYYNILVSKGRKEKVIKAILDEWEIPYGEKISYAKYNPKKKYYWMEPDEQVLGVEWTPVLFNVDTMLMTILKVPKGELFTGDNGGLLKRKDKRKQKSLHLKFLDESFVESVSKINFSPYVYEVIKVIVGDS